MTIDSPHPATGTEFYKFFFIFMIDKKATAPEGLNFVFKTLQLSTSKQLKG